MERKSTAGKTAIAIFLVASGAFCLPAAAQGKAEAYRCGNTYTDRPCQGENQ
jgi:di/tricarboxylate transporter